MSRRYELDIRLDFYDQSHLYMATVVTAYFEVDAKRPTSDYYDYIKLFMQIDANVVFFTTANLVPIFQAMRSHNIVYVLTDLMELESIKKYGYDAWVNWCNTDSQPHHHGKPWLGAIWHDKKDFVMKAIDLNPFNSDIFIWCDAGAVRTTEWFPMIKKFGINTYKIPEDKILMQYIEESGLSFSNQVQYVNYPPFCGVAGAILAGHRDAWKLYRDAYDYVVQSYIQTKHNPFVDQHIMTSVAFLRPDIVQLVRPYECKIPFNDIWFFFLSHLSS